MSENGLRQGRLASHAWEGHTALRGRRTWKKKKKKKLQCVLRPTEGRPQICATGWGRIVKGGRSGKKKEIRRVNNGFCGGGLGEGEGWNALTDLPILVTRVEEGVERYSSTQLLGVQLRGRGLGEGGGSVR